MATYKVVDADILDSNFTDIADAIRAKADSQSTYTPAQMPQAIANIKTSGWPPGFDSVADGTSWDVETTLPTESGGVCIFLAHGTGANVGIQNLKIHGATRFGGFCFSGSGPNGLRKLILTDCFKMYCQSNPSCNNFNNLREFTAPNLAELIEPQNRGMFSGCESLQVINVPSLQLIPSNCFKKTGITTADLTATTLIADGAFNQCSQLTALILRRTAQMVTLWDSTSLAQSAIAQGSGYIYVPRAFLSSYQSETNWSAYASRFRVLEDYTVDGTVDGEIDWSKT